MTDRGGDLVLRAFDAGDTPFIRRLAQDPRIVRYVGDGAPWTEEHLQRRIADALDPRSSTTWQIAIGPDGVAVGLLSVVADPDGIEIGYWVDPAAWNNGHAGRLIEHACAAAPAGRPTIARVHPENTASRRVLERAGFHNTPGRSDALLTYRREARTRDVEGQQSSTG